jgi:DNA polymerase III subunit epsilon
MLVTAKNKHMKNTDTNSSSDDLSSLPPVHIASISPGLNLVIKSVEMRGSRPTTEATDEEVEDFVKNYMFIETKEPVALDKEDIWFDESIHKRQISNKSKAATSWANPFFDESLLLDENFLHIKKTGALAASSLQKELRKRLKEQIKLNQDVSDLLRSFYGVSVLVSFFEFLSFLDWRPWGISKFVSKIELTTVPIDYQTIGYQHLNSLLKTDIKWLIAHYGEPKQHSEIPDVFSAVKANAISRCCWHEMNTTNASSRSLGWPEKTMDEYVRWASKLHLGYQKQWRENVAAKKLTDKEIKVKAGLAIDDTYAEFVVADIETTGLRYEVDEIIELSAVRANANGKVLQTFTALVKPNNPIPKEIVELTGITEAEIQNDGQSEKEAFSAFHQFLKDSPVFFHNAPFDLGFLNKAASRYETSISNRIHDTLIIAKAAWPVERNYKLSTLAKLVKDAPEPRHRGLADASTTLAVLMEARERINYFRRKELDKSLGY